MNIVLIGYRGSGKSTVGRKLADRLQMKFVDTDDCIEERYKASINDIVELRGWDHFRMLEKGIIEEISKKDHFVIAPGGGAVVDTDNVMALRKNGFIVWLKADVQVLLQRMVNDPQTATGRPSLTGKGALEELKEVLALREGFYERASEVQVDTSLLDVDGVANKVLSILEGKAVRV
ncbi:MAG: hypothetical protein A2169_14450 [Deltaproteobacteria bacterium RBG_13_47_9]|nr:MAG: hypothetical protein A2169_14450 [Deltaproteobacteria bacterium RBG_13_47_9]